MSFKQGGTPLSGQFHLKNTNPIDSRYVITSTEEYKALVEKGTDGKYKFLYPGLTFTVTTDLTYSDNGSQINITAGTYQVNTDGETIYPLTAKTINSSIDKIISGEQAVGKTQGTLTINSQNFDGSTDMEIGTTDKDIKLSADLYTYTPIGFAQTASNYKIGTGSTISRSNPGKLGSANESSLRDVLNIIFGEEVDIQPNINTSAVKLTVSSNAGTYGGDEFGTSVPSTTITYTITLSNNATAQYGYRCGDTYTKTTDASIYYPAKKAYNTSNNETAQLKISLPSNKNVTVNTGTLVYNDSTNNILYCNFNDGKTVKFTVALDSTTVTTNTQTRYGQVSAEVTLGTAQTEDTNNATATETNSNIITAFLAYKPVDKTYEDSTVNVNGTNIGTSGKLSDSESSITVSSGYIPYAWELAISAVAENSNLPTTNKRKSAYTSIPISDANGTKNLYIYIPSGKSITDIKNNNQAAPYACDAESRSLKVNGQSTNFKVYHVNAKVAAGTNNFTITYS